LNAFYDSKAASTQSREHLLAIEKARAITTAYTLYYQRDGYKTALIEDAFCLPICDPKTNQPIPERYYTGIIDCMVKRDGVLYVSDHKTVGKLDNDYWFELETNPQLTHYLLGLFHLGVEVDGFLWDVILKPGISPKKLTKAAKEEIADGTYCGQSLREPYNDEDDETPSLFGIRVFVEYTNDPARFFQRRVIRRTQDQLLEYAEELAADCHEMMSCESDKAAARRNLNFCKSFGSLCTFHQICASGKRNGYAPAKERPNDHPHVRKGSLSPSRISTFKGCKRKWWYQYREKIEKQTRPFNDSLELGSLVHKGLEIYLADRQLPSDEQVKLAPLSERILNESV
jgi:hypothetical protein